MTAEEIAYTLGRITMVILALYLGSKYAKKLFKKKKDNGKKTK